MMEINKEICAGCGKCVVVCPDGIEMKEGIAIIKNENATCLKNAKEVCPVNAIILE